MSALRESLLALLRRSCIQLPTDARKALESAERRENEGSRSKEILQLLLENVRLAEERGVPMTAHTSSIHFFVMRPDQFDQNAFEAEARAAVEQATAEGLIEPNLIDPVTGKAIKTNVGPGMPQFHYEPLEANGVELEVWVLVKGNGAEGSGVQLVLPDSSMGADYDLDGVHRAVLEAVSLIQGRGCGPGVIGVGIGGDRASGMTLATRQLIRPVGNRNSTRVLSKLEQRLLEDANSLGIGPIGFGGRSTLLDVHIGAAASPTESCYVSISYLGWAARRQGIQLDGKGGLVRWMLEIEEIPSIDGDLPKPQKPSATPSKSKAKKKTATKAAPPADEPAADDDGDGEDADESKTAKKKTAKKKASKKKSKSTRKATK